MVSHCCRLCLLQGPDLLPILELKVNSKRANAPVIAPLSQLIVSYLSIEPVFMKWTETFVCSECRNTIAKWHWFRESCLQNDGIYQKMAQDPVHIENYQVVELKQEQEIEIGEYEINYSPEQIDEYQVIEVKREQEIEIDEHGFNENLYTAPQDEDHIEKVVVVEVKQEVDTDEEEVAGPSFPPLSEKQKRKKSTGKRGKGEPPVKQKSGGSPKNKQNGMHRCPHCSMIFRTENNLKDHVNIHTKEIKYICPVCEKVFWRNETLKMHLAMSHTEQRQITYTNAPSIKCLKCGLKFSSRSEMFKHVATHSTKQLIACNICNRYFSKKHHLEAHIKLTHRRAYP